MNARQLRFALLGCVLLSSPMFVAKGNSTAPMKTPAVSDEDLLAGKFQKVKEGMSEPSVLRIMGDPQYKNGDTWQYSLTRAPRPGEQLMIYQITFQDHKVARKQIIPGPDATGPGK